MLEREDIIAKAVHDCLAEMYQKSQPQGDYDKYIELAKEGQIGKDEKVFDRHYLPEKEFEYIADKYRDAYDFKDHWISDCELILECLKNGGFKNGWNKTLNCHAAEKTQAVKDLIGEDNAEIVIKLIENLKDFYRFGKMDLEKFNFNVYLGASPTSNADTVREYWKSQGIDVEIDEKKDLTKNDFWQLDMYGEIIED